MKRLIVILCRILGGAFSLFGVVFLVVGFMQEEKLLYVSSGFFLIIFGALLIVAKKGYLSDFVADDFVDKIFEKIDKNKW